MRKTIYIFLALLLVACGGQSEPVAEPIEVVVEETAVVEPTPEPTETPLPEPTEEPTEEPSPTPEPTEEPVAEQDPEWVTYAVPANGFYLDLPASWREVPLDEETLVGAAEALQNENPEIAELLSADVMQQFLLSGASFLSFDLSIESVLMSSPANVNIIKERRLSPTSLEFHLETTKGILENFPNVSSEVVSEIVNLSYGPVGKQMFELTIVLPDGTPLQRETLQYVFIDGVEIYTITFSYDESNAKRYAPILEEIANSFHLGDAPEGAIVTGPAEETVIDAALAVQILPTDTDTQLSLLDLADSISIILIGNFLESDNGAMPEIASATAQRLDIPLPDFDQVEPFDFVSLSIALLESREILHDYASANYGPQATGFTDIFLYGTIIDILYVPEVDNPVIDAAARLFEEGSILAGISPDLYGPVVEGVANKIDRETNSANVDRMLNAILVDIEAGVIDLSQETAVTSTEVSSETSTDLNPQWILSKLSETLAFAALGQGFGLSEDRIAENVELANLLATELQINLPNLYDNVPHDDLEAGVQYIFDVQAILMTYAEANLGPEEASVVELIMSSRLVQALYDPENFEQTELYLDTLVSAAYNSGLPEEFFVDFLNNLRNNENGNAIADSVNQMLFDINQHFENEPVELNAYLPNAERLFWHIGRELAIAGLSQGFDFDQSIIDDSYRNVRDFTSLLGLTIPDMIELVPKGDRLAAFEYIFDVQAIVGEHASAFYGSEEEGIVGIGVQTVFISIMYEPDNEDLTPILEERLMESVSLTNIPIEVFAPITNGFAAKISESEMRSRIDDLKEYMEAYVNNDS
ncbi:MAG: hypothetical protein AAF490_13185 [Chloroflexota bacterium]